jgi:type IV secretory pathway VirB2 component (pilin)
MLRKSLTRTLPVCAVLMLFSAHAWASSAGMPWEGPMSRLVQSLTGPIAKGIGVASIFACGCGLAFGEGGSGLKKVLWVTIGLAVTFTAATWGLSFMGFSGGLGV